MDVRDAGAGADSERAGRVCGWFSARLRGQSLMSTMAAQRRPGPEAPAAHCATGPQISARRPRAWLRDCERLTRDHRNQRAEHLRERARELASEAWAVIEAVQAARVQEADPLGERQWCELGQLWDAVCAGDHSGAPDTPIVRAVLRWDGELAARQNQRWRTRWAARPSGALFADVVQAIADDRPAGRAGCDADVPRRIALERGAGFGHWLDLVQREAQRRLDSRWHGDRARGIETAFDRAESCNTEPRGVVRCACGSSVEVRIECANHWVCQHCRDKRKRKYRRRFLAGRTATLRAIGDARLQRGQTTSYFAERFMTLTMPRAQDAEHGCEIIRKAWRLFWSRFRAAIVRHYAGSRTKAAQREYRRLIRCVRVIEVAEGADATGHVHLHVWLVSPYIRAEVIRAMWGRALLSAGFPAERVELTLKENVLESVRNCHWSRRALRKFPRMLFYPRIDIRIVRDSVPRKSRHGETAAALPCADLVNEIIKYLCKDLGAGGKAIDPRLWSAIYRGLGTARIITATHGFWVRVAPAPCAQCGATHWTLELAPRPAPRANAPPLLALCGTIGARR